MKPNTRPLVATLARSWVLLCALVCPAIALAQAGPPEDWSSVTTRIETDGSLGFAPAQAIFPDGFDVYTIGEALGERAGSNLFHSFLHFDLGAGDTARFTATEFTENVVSRVTGGAPSKLNGTLASDISGADFYFLNPSGVFFGPAASLDVPAAFHVSTAERLDFDEGESFPTGLGGSPASLSLATPDSFGFFGTAPIGRIGVEQSTLEVRAGEALALVGGDLDVNGGSIQAPGGTISVVSVASQGEVAFDPSVSWESMDATSFDAYGAVRLRGASQLVSTGDPAGSISIHAGSIELSGGSVLESNGLGSTGNAPRGIDLRAGTVSVAGGAAILATVEADASGAGGDIVIAASDAVTISGVDPVDYSESKIDASTAGEGAGGSIYITARAVTLEAGGAILATVEKNTSVDTGAGGNIAITASESVKITGANAYENAASQVSASTSDAGKGGSIAIEAPEVTVENGGAIFATVQASATGAGGDIVIMASDAVTVSGGGPYPGRSASQINASTFGGADGGKIIIEAPEVTVEYSAAIEAATRGGSGAGGSIAITADRVIAQNAARIFAPTLGSGTGGDIRITASEFVRVGGVTSPQQDPTPSAVSASTQGSGNGGSIIIEAPTISVEDGAGIYVATAGIGKGGDIRITASEEVRLSGVTVRNQNPVPSVVSATTFGPGLGGSITIEAPTVSVEDGAAIQAVTLSTGDSGDIRITASEEVQFSDVKFVSGVVFRSHVNASTFGSGDGGLISIDASTVAVEEGAAILAVTGATGAGGDIAITASDAVRVSGSDPVFGLTSLVSASTLGSGNGGSIRIEAPDVSVRSDATIEAATRGGSGAGGSIAIDSDAVRLSGGSQISVFASVGAEIPEGLGPGAPSAGSADGNIAIEARDLLLLEGGSRIEASVESGLGGSITIGGSLEELPNPMDPDRTIFRAVGPNQGVVLREGSAILAQARGDEQQPKGSSSNALPAANADSAEVLTARGGDIEMNARAVLVCSDCEINADGPTSTSGGSVVLDSPETAIESQLIPPNVSYVDASSMLLAECGQSGGGEDGGGRFTLARWPDLSLSAEDPLLAFSPDDAALNEPEETRRALTRAREALEQATPEASTAIYLRLASLEAARARQDPGGRREALLAAHADLLRARDSAQRQRNGRAAAQALGQLGALYLQEGGRDEEARYVTRRALELAEQEQAADLLVRWYAQLGQLEWRNARIDDALDAYRRGVSLLGETRPEAASSGRADLAFRQAVEPVYLALVDLLLQSSAQAPTPESRQSQLAEARQVVEQWKAAELRNYFHDSCAAEFAATSRTVESVDPHAAVIYPIVLPDRLELLVSRASGIERFTVAVSAEQLQGEVTRFRRLLGKRVTDEYKTSAQQLYAWLVAPYLPLLKQEALDTLVFVPGGALRTVPMAALHDGEHFLIERFAVAITPSLDLLAPEPLDLHETDLLLAGLSEPVQGYRGLPGVPDELAAIEALYGGEVLLDQSFDRARLASVLRNDRPGVVHLASHAEFTGDPDSSFVLTHDDRLSMEELAALVRTTRYGDEPVELLLLSACQTAVGNERAALGLAGMAIRAGARSAMGSLWWVSDEATSKLVIDFYQALDTPGISKARALQQAQRVLLGSSEFHHPYYWAAFLLINNWL